MTDDEKAKAALELLGGIRRCHLCEANMVHMGMRINTASGITTVRGWSCWICYYYVTEGGEQVQEQAVIYTFDI